MGQWDDKFKQHPIHESLSTVADNLKALHDHPRYAAIEDAVTRAETVLKFIRSRIRKVDGALAGNATPNHVNGQLTAAIQNIQQFQSNGNAQHVNGNMANAIDEAARQTCLFPIRVTKGDAQALSEEASLFREHAEALINQLNDSKVALEKQLEELGQRILKHQEVLSQQQLAIDAQTARLDTIVQDQQQQFAQAQKERQSEFEELAENATRSAQDVIEILETKKKEASDLVHVVGNIGVTGNYQKIANEEARVANRFRWIAVFFFCLMVSAIASTIFFKLENGVNWEVALFRLLAGAIFAVPAGYAAVESARHRKVEMRNRRLELELASLDPFLEKLNEEKRSSLKEELARRYFGQEESETDDHVSPTSLFGLLEKAIAMLGKRV